MIKIHLDPKDLLDACKDSKEEVEKALSKGVKGLAVAAQRHMEELVKDELNTHQADMFFGGKDKKNIEFSNPEANVYVITIKDTAVLIDDGKEIDMKTDKWLFSSSKTKQGKNGRYLVIPFNQNKKSNQRSDFENTLNDRIKFELAAQNKKRKANGLSKITMGGIERDEKGQIKEGKLHSFDVFGNRRKSSWSDQPLSGLSVYQKIERDEQGNPKTDKAGKVKVARSWMTFRTASESTKVDPKTGVAPKDKFFYPAPPTKNFLERTGEWAEEEFYNKIVPEIFAKWKD